jgi:hypothetical protein
LQRLDVPREDQDVPATKQTDVMVLVDPDAAGGLQAVAKALRAAGMTGLRVQRATGTITGQAPTREVAARLASVPGVLNVEASSHDYAVPPPDSDLQ